jgi:hypothetical protein
VNVGLGRRELVAGLLGLTACGGAPAAAPLAPVEQPLGLSSAVELLPAPGLTWLVDAKLRELFSSPALLPALSLLLPPARLDAFAARHGGVDLRAVGDLAIASYPETTLWVVLTSIIPARIEAAFAERAVAVEGRAIDGSVVRTWGTVGSAREQLAILGHEGVVLEHGHFGPLQAAEYFAQRKLKRARPALQSEPLVRVAEALGAAPLRALAPGPFVGDLGHGLGGLLAAATAVGAAATPVPSGHGDGDGVLQLRFVVTGAWGQDAPAAEDRLRAAFDLLGADPLGRLLGVDRPVEPPAVDGNAEALQLTVGLDVTRLAEGLKDATSATLEEVMR